MLKHTTRALTAFLLAACAAFAQSAAAGTPPPWFYLHEIFMPPGNTNCTPFSINDNDMVAVRCKQPDLTFVLYRYYLSENRIEPIVLPAGYSLDGFRPVYMNNWGDLVGRMTLSPPNQTGENYPFFVPSGSVEAQQLIINGDNAPTTDGITDERLIYGATHNNYTGNYSGGAYVTHIINGYVYNYASASGTISKVWLNSSSTIMIQRWDRFTSKYQYVYGKVGDAILREVPAGVNPDTVDYLDDRDVLHGVKSPPGQKVYFRWANIDGTETGNYHNRGARSNKTLVNDSSRNIFKVGQTWGWPGRGVPAIFSEDTIYKLDSFAGGTPRRLILTNAISINRTNKIALQGGYKTPTVLPPNTFFLACPTPGCQ